MNSKTDFIQFEKCELCQVHHRKKHRHVYSKSHQQNVHRCLSKFKKKIEASLITIKKPIISAVCDKDEVATNLHQNEETNQLLMCSRLGIPLADEAVLGLEDGNEMSGKKLVNFWCYFCQKELQRDDVDRDLIIRYGLFWRHLQNWIRLNKIWEDFHSVSEDNKEGDLRLAWVLNRGYKYSEHHEKRDMFWRKHKVDKYHKYKKENFALSEDVIKRFNQAVEIALKEFIHEREARLKRLHVNGRSTTKQFPWKPMNQSGGSVPLARVRTVAAEARGLSIIKIKDFDDKIVAAVKRGKLPPNRVGAKEHLNEEKRDSDWLPSFGRVWSKNPRTQVRKTFMANLGGVHHPTSTVTTASPTFSCAGNGPETNITGVDDEQQQYLHHLNNDSVSSNGMSQDYNAGIDNSNYYWHSPNLHDAAAFASPFSVVATDNVEVDFPKDIHHGYVKKQRLAKQCDHSSRIPISDKLLN
ncbi:hypothetical protein LSH36_874g01071 [Paralvinella palmiformis]|uniref:Uncharacterized protein n=1 Tax=Paralvinella palmiformis TaxID=53620 RepID=A0AAD9IYZ6_9ANNE|nr:hypothetical protein LSH36_874g01071 [Paralvinella palmiformis]